MTIPALLAFPPTSLRNVAAGLVVGNPVGSSGTRGKALTSAELKAIVEASGISYLPLAGGTLTGPITGTGGLIEHRNGLTAQCLDIFETYTSGTNNGKLRLKATSAGHQIGSARASSGSNRALLFGHYDGSDAFTTAMTIATGGTVTIPVLSAAITSITGYAYTPGFAAMLGYIGAGTLRLSNVGGVQWSVNTNGADTIDTGVMKASAGVVEINNGVLGTLRDLSLRAITASGQMTHIPPTSSITLATNGQFSIEMTSNTAGNLVYRGSDGTTRRMALTFS